MAAELRIYQGDPEPAPDELTLRQAWQLHWLPTNQYLVAESTTQRYRTVIGHWEAFVAERAVPTRNGAQDSLAQIPIVDAVSRISGPVLNEFGRWLMEENPSQRRRLSTGTVGQYANKLHAILRSVGPKSGSYPQSPELIAFVPKMAPPKRLNGGKSDPSRKGIDLTNDQVGALYDACAIARWPADQPVLQWRTYVVLGTLIGPRAEDGATMRPASISLDPQIPLEGSRLTSQHGWIDFHADKTDKRHLIPMPPALAAHIGELMRRRGGRLFAWRSRRQHRFCDQWNAIVAQAGLTDVSSIAPKHLIRKDLRSTAKNRWDRASGAVTLGEFVLGHAAKGVSDKHYTNRLPDLIEAAPRVEVPEQFTSSLSSGGTTQQFLF